MGRISGPDPTRVTLPHDTPHFRQAGLLWFELLWFDLLALDGSVLRHAAWSTPKVGQAPACLGVVICTFDRPELAGVLAAIADGDGLDDVVARVVVVNQGRPGLLRQDAVAPSPHGSSHASLSVLRQRYPDAWTSRDRVLPPWLVRSSPRTCTEFTWVMLRSLAHNWVSPTRDAPPRRLAVWDLVWLRALGSEHLAVDTHWDRELPIYRRDCETSGRY